MTTVWLVSIGGRKECPNRKRHRRHECRECGGRYDPALADTVRRFDTFEQAQTWCRDVVGVAIEAPEPPPPGLEHFASILGHVRVYCHSNLVVQEVAPEKADDMMRHRLADGKHDPACAAACAALFTAAENMTAAIRETEGVEETEVQAQHYVPCAAELAAADKAAGELHRAAEEKVRARKAKERAQNGEHDPAYAAACAALEKAAQEAEKAAQAVDNALEEKVWKNKREEQAQRDRAERGKEVSRDVGKQRSKTFLYVLILFAGDLFTVSAVSSAFNLPSEAVRILTKISLYCAIAVAALGIGFAGRWINLKTTLITTVLFCLALFLWVAWMRTRILTHAG